METQGDSKIKYLLECDSERIREGRIYGYTKNDKISEFILSLDTEKVPGVRVKNLNKKVNSNIEEGDWLEYQILYEIDKYKDTPDYIGHVFKCLGKIFNSFSHLDISSIGIQEIDCSYSDYYYILIYILSDGREKNKKDKEDYFSAGGGECV